MPADDEFDVFYESPVEDDPDSDDDFASDDDDLNTDDDDFPTNAADSTTKTANAVQKPTQFSYKATAVISVVMHLIQSNCGISKAGAFWEAVATKYRARFDIQRSGRALQGLYSKLLKGGAVEAFGEDADWRKYVNGLSKAAKKRRQRERAEEKQRMEEEQKGGEEMGGDMDGVEMACAKEEGGDDETVSTEQQLTEAFGAMLMAVRPKQLVEKDGMIMRE